MNEFTSEPVEWVITAHAAERVADRHGVEFNSARLRPMGLGRTGLRLWVDSDGRGVLVLEDAGTGWRRLTVITAFEAAAVKTKIDANLFRPMKLSEWHRWYQRQFDKQAAAQARAGRL